MLSEAINQALPFLRAEEEGRQRDTCRITRPSDESAEMDPETGEYVDPLPIVMYEGPCRIPKRDGGSASTSDADGWQVGEYPLSLPIEGTENIRTGMTVTYLTSADDPALAGNVYGITREADQSQATARRFHMKRVTSD